MKKSLLITLTILVTLPSFAQRTKLKNVWENNSKIGIGTKNPDQLLTVKGTIHAQEVLVDLEGVVAPDYVFESYFEGTSESQPDYELKSLEDLGNYVAENHHLPRVPAAKELEEEGLSLKKMSLILLEKIEELTLYTLQQQLEIEALKKEVEKLSEQAQEK
ncbi:MAG TPA: hypothetical protein PKW08_06140 [Flavobacteriaceae bacterium]|nr:hypothetical protein [Flavobacteriaceae bacterium]MCB9213969.1 hypothetical protein [Alteromonas sp.]HPF11872.1 hypothetical protein [Flavobacteriaceae bacterium]HQU21149.1 hypothetical protein [Flavobacteriaceae bacterium]HQU65349.1 hypothetical protein [Flavobacteriaceae bacterium]